MKIRLAALETNSLARFIFRFVRHCQVVLDSGTIVEFTRGSELVATSIISESSLTKEEQWQADRLYEM